MSTNAKLSLKPLDIMGDNADMSADEFKRELTRRERHNAEIDKAIKFQKWEKAQELCSEGVEELVKWYTCLDDRGLKDFADYVMGTEYVRYYFRDEPEERAVIEKMANDPIDFAYVYKFVNRKTEAYCHIQYAYRAVMQAGQQKISELKGIDYFPYKYYIGVKPPPADSPQIILDAYKLYMDCCAPENVSRLFRYARERYSDPEDLAMIDVIIKRNTITYPCEKYD